MPPRIVQSTTETIVDEQGNVKRIRHNERIDHGDEPAYVKLYLRDLMYVADMPKHYTQVVLSLLKRVSYASDEDGMCVTLVPRTKRAICAELGWEKTSSLDNALQKLLKGKIIFRVDRGVFRLNPYLFGKGDWKDIGQIRMEVTYSIHGKTFAAVCGDATDTPDQQEPVAVPVPTQEAASQPDQADQVSWEDAIAIAQAQAAAEAG